jgi:hypothetical protein
VGVIGSSEAAGAATGVSGLYVEAALELAAPEPAASASVQANIRRRNLAARGLGPVVALDPLNAITLTSIIRSASPAASTENSTFRVSVVLFHPLARLQASFPYRGQGPAAGSAIGLIGGAGQLGDVVRQDVVEIL